MKKVLFYLLLVLLFSCTKKQEDDIPMEPIQQWTDVVYQPALTKVVAVNGTNVLVRGSFPIDGQRNFVYNQILDVVRARLPFVNFSNHTMIDISMIDNNSNAEWPQLRQELQAFSLRDSVLPVECPPYTVGYEAKLLGTFVSGHYGRFLWWPIQGFNPAMPWEQKVGQFFTNNGWNGEPGGYNFDGLVDRLDLLLKDTAYPKIIYYHDTWGKDRAGALTFGWLVKHGDYAKDIAIASVDSVVAPNEIYSGMINDYYTWLFR